MSAASLEAAFSAHDAKQEPSMGVTPPPWGEELEGSSILREAGDSVVVISAPHGGTLDGGLPDREPGPGRCFEEDTNTVPCSCSLTTVESRHRTTSVAALCCCRVVG